MEIAVITFALQIERIENQDDIRQWRFPRGSSAFSARSTP